MRKSKFIKLYFVHPIVDSLIEKDKQIEKKKNKRVLQKSILNKIKSQKFADLIVNNSDQMGKYVPDIRIIV